MPRYTLLTAALVGLATAQSLLGTTPEVHPKLKTWKCTKAGGCKVVNSAIVIDAGSHGIRQKNNPSLGCGDFGSKPPASVCPDKETCAKNCVMDGISDYKTMGVTTQGSSLRLDMFNPQGGEASPRVYLLGEDEKNYEMLKLTGQEFTFDVDMSRLPCGMNGALYLSEMAASGGRSKLNPGGATYGTGYCDAQCFVTPWLNGEGNVKGQGVCCNEMDIWEANKAATQIAPTHAARAAFLAAQATSAAPPVSVTRTDAETTRTTSASPQSSMALARRSTPPSLSPSLPSSRPRMVFSKLLSANTFKTARSSRML
ncbi:Endoglucanase EG-1 [Pyrenophora teres f. teres]|nr:Endoglucanase EG-1 [Pyrenophora teres f. teres]